MPKKTELYITGMHCKSCEILIERELNDIKGIQDTKASLKDGKVTFNSKLEKKNLIKEINSRINDKGYTVDQESKEEKVNISNLLLAFIISSTILLLFIALQKLGIADIINATELTYPVVFLIGIVASLSSCMAVVGGLVLSISSTYSKSGSKVLPLTLFHISRLLSFLILGGLLGLIGSMLELTPMFYFVMSTIVFIVMIILGLNLLDIPFFKRFNLTLPKAFSNSILKTEGVKNIFAPVLLGFLTFFLPCGFTQSMQITAIAYADILKSSLTMFVFALGTFPVLALISFSSTKLSKGANSSLFFKVAGFLVIFFSIYTFISSLISIGVLRPIF
jgi:sulfite exporter TauE/SafE/copper chaperone CopZ